MVGGSGFMHTRITTQHDEKDWAVLRLVILRSTGRSTTKNSGFPGYECRDTRARERFIGSPDD